MTVTRHTSPDEPAGDEVRYLGKMAFRLVRREALNDAEMAALCRDEVEPR